MGTYADKLRSDAGELRQNVAEILKVIQATPGRLRERLVAASTRNTIEAIKTDLDSIISSIPTGAAESRMIAVTTGSVTANVLEHLADLVDYLSMTGSLKRVGEKLRENREFMKAMNIAVAQGNWDEYDRILDRFAGRNGSDQGQPAEKPAEVAAGNGSG